MMDSVYWENSPSLWHAPKSRSIFAPLHPACPIRALPLYVSRNGAFFLMLYGSVKPWGEGSLC